MTYFDHDPSEPTNRPSIDTMRRLADELIEECKAHEDMAHDGQTCTTERVSVTAYIGHSLGLRECNGEAIGRFLALYTQSCKHPTESSP